MSLKTPLLFITEFIEQVVKYSLSQPFFCPKCKRIRYVKRPSWIDTGI